MDIKVKVDISEPKRKFAYWMNKRQRKNCMKAVRRAGAAVIHKHIKSTGAFTDRTRTLRKSFKVKTTREGYVYWLANAPHAFNVEHGTERGASPHPYAVPEAVEHGDEAVRAGMEKFKTYIDKMFRK